MADPTGYDPSLGEAPGNFDPTAPPAFNATTDPASIPNAPDAPIPPTLARPPEQTQYVSRPAAKAPTDPFKVVGSIPEGTSTSTSQVDLGKAGQEARKTKDAADQASLAAGDKIDATRTELLQQQEAAAKEKVAISARFDAEQALKADEFAKTAAKDFQGIKTAADDFERASRELSPNHFWQQQSTGQKIGNLLATALSGLGNVFQAKGGARPNELHNGALDMINLAIDRDIDMQKTALQAKERGISIKQSVYAATLQAGANDQQARAAARSAALGKIDRDVEVMVAHSTTEQSKVAGEQLRANLQQAKAAEDQRLAELTAKRTQVSTSSKPVTAIEMAGMQGAQQAAQDAAYRKANGLVEKNPALATDMGQARDPESARELAKAKLALGPAEKAVQVFERLGKKKVLGPQEEAIFNAARADYMAFAKGPYGAQLGVLSGPDMELLSPTIPTRDAWKLFTGKDNAVTSYARSKIDEVKKNLKGYTVKTE